MVTRERSISPETRTEIRQASNSGLQVMLRDTKRMIAQAERMTSSPREELYSNVIRDLRDERRAIRLELLKRAGVVIVEQYKYMAPPELPTSQI